MRRRQFIAGLGGAAAWPTAARAQQGERVRRVGVSSTAGDSLARARHTAFVQMLSQLGWTEGRNVIVVEPFGAIGDSGINAVAEKLMAEVPDVIVSVGEESTAILKRKTNVLPIVFINVTDPVANGLVESFARPAANITGFTSVEFSFAGKWLSILTDLAPGVSNVMVLYSPENPNWVGYLRTLEAGAPSVQVTLHAAPMTAVEEVSGAIESLAQQSGPGMIVLPGGQTVVNREIIASLAIRYRVPAIYPYKYFATSGGLASYGSDDLDLFRRAAQYVDRILRGARPGDLPVQAPTKFEFVINLKAARAIGLTVPSSLQLLADELIE
jgi:putative tryptophan/tyrosine transport system substrate-binding protein